MYSSFPPCGDATIFPITKDQNHLQDEQSIPVENNTNGTENNEPPLKKFKQSNDNVEDTPNKIDKTENKESEIEKTLLSESRYADDLNRTGIQKIFHYCLAWPVLNDCTPTIIQSTLFSGISCA